MGSKAFADFYNRNFEYVYSYIYARTAGNAYETADIVQEAFTAAFKAMNGFRGLSSEKTWIMAIARNKLHDWYRKQFGNRERFEDETLADGIEKLENLASDENVEEAVLKDEVRSNVTAALSAINPDYRLILVMKYLDEASVKEIAAVTGRTPKAVDGMLQRAKAGFAAAYIRLDRKDGFCNG
jgi:RNA polymerase sigma-70 factor (ECF subfamily)